MRHVTATRERVCNRSAPPVQETESPAQGGAKAKICRADSSLSSSNDSSSGEGAGLAKAAGLLGLDEDILTRKVAFTCGIGPADLPCFSSQVVAGIFHPPYVASTGRGESASNKRLLVMQKIQRQSFSCCSKYFMALSYVFYPPSRFCGGQ